MATLLRVDQRDKGIADLQTEFVEFEQVFERFNAVLAEMVSMALRYEGWNIATAGDGASALESARSQRPDVVVLDVMLPDMSGLEVLRKLREETPQLPVLLLTAKDALEEVVGQRFRPWAVRELVDPGSQRALDLSPALCVARHDGPTSVGRVADRHQLLVGERRAGVGVQGHLGDPQPAVVDVGNTPYFQRRCFEFQILQVSLPRR